MNQENKLQHNFNKKWFAEEEMSVLSGANNANRVKRHKKCLRCKNDKSLKAVEVSIEVEGLKAVFTLKD